MNNLSHKILLFLGSQLEYKLHICCDRVGYWILLVAQKWEKLHYVRIWGKNANYMDWLFSEPTLQSSWIETTATNDFPVDDLGCEPEQKCELFTLRDMFLSFLWNPLVLFDPKIIGSIHTSRLWTRSEIMMTESVRKQHSHFHFVTFEATLNFKCCS